MLDFSTQQTLDQIALTADAQAAKVINDRHREVVRLGRTAKDIAAEIGGHLIAVKADLDHGEFGPWCEKNLIFTVRKAQRYIKAAKIKNDDVVAFARAETLDELVEAKTIKQRREEKVERRAATLDDLRKVERLQALRDDEGAPDGERQAAQAMLDKIEAEIGPVEPLLSENSGAKKKAKAYPFGKPQWNRYRSWELSQKIALDICFRKCPREAAELIQKALRRIATTRKS